MTHPQKVAFAKTFAIYFLSLCALDYLFFHVFCSPEVQQIYIVSVESTWLNFIGFENTVLNLADHHILASQFPVIEHADYIADALQRVHWLSILACWLAWATAIIYWLSFHKFAKTQSSSIPAGKEVTPLTH